ncbi:hypothetical protein MT418_002683 [Batrachochytrium dendrobatidis]
MFQLFSTATTLVAFCIGITSAVPTTINGEIIVHHAEQPHPLTKAKPAFDRFGVIVLENQDFDAAMEDPYMGTELRKKGMLLTNYHALTHPSQPNYLAMISGSTSGVFMDFPANINRKTIVDLMEAKNVSWKTYQEDYPGNCYTGTSQGLYYRKHNPFITFTTISKNPARCAKIVNSNQLLTDIKAEQVPQYFFYTPNINNDGHNTDITTASNWLKNFLEPLLANPYFDRTVFLVTFDENDWLLPWFDNNQIYSLLVGKPVKPNTSDNTEYNHYSQMTTVQARWDLGSLGAGNAPAFNL